LQAPLYLMAVKATGMFYVGSRAAWCIAGWNEIPEGWLERKKEQTLQVVAEIRGDAWMSRRPIRTSADTANSAMCAGLEVGQAEALAEGA